jgi:hypothetical protein
MCRLRVRERLIQIRRSGVHDDRDVVAFEPGADLTVRVRHVAREQPAGERETPVLHAVADLRGLGIEIDGPAGALDPAAGAPGTAATEGRAGKLEYRNRIKVASSFDPYPATSIFASPTLIACSWSSSCWTSGVCRRWTSANASGSSSLGPLVRATATAAAIRTASPAPIATSHVRPLMREGSGVPPATSPGGGGS